VRANPAEPLPALLVVAQELGDEALRERVTALVAVLRRLGVGIVFCGSSPLGATVTVKANGAVASSTGRLISGSDGVRLYTLSLEAAAELLSVIAASRGALVPETVAGEAPLPMVTPPPVSDRVGPPVHLSLFSGLPVVRVHGQELDVMLDRVTPPGGTQAERERLRDRGRELLAFLALHPEGATKEQTLAELLRDDETAKALDKLRRDINNIRNVLRRATQLPERKFVEFVAERYRLDTEVIDTDVWEVERALNERRNGERSDQVTLLSRVLSAYRGQLLEHAPYEWVTPALRESYVRRVVDAGERLVQLLEATGDIEGAIDAAERTLAADPDDEELYQRLMRLHVAAGRNDAAKRVLRELKAHLAEIDPELEPAEETVRLLRQ
jgi:DNA-binding SARP family transcriptional activator